MHRIFMCTAQQSHGVVVAVHRWELTGYNLFLRIQSILLVLLHCLVMRFTSHSRLSHHGRAHTYRHTHRHTHTHTFSHKPTHLSQIAKSQRPPDQVAALPPSSSRVPDGHPAVWHGRSRSKEDASSEVAVGYQNGMSNR